MQNKTLLLVIKYLISASFFIPLVLVSSSFIFPFIVPKILLFRTCVLLMLGFYILLLISNWRQYIVKLTLVNTAVFLFFVSFSVSTFLGVDWYKSFWDNHERMLGLFTLLHYLIYYLVITSVIKEWHGWKFLLRMFLIAGSIVMLIGCWQKFIDPEAVLNRNNTRVSATLGNAIYFSGYGLFLFFIGLLLFFKENRFDFWKYTSAFGALLGFIGVFIGGTRGTLVGLMCGCAILCFAYFFILEKENKLRKILGVVICLGILVSISLFIFRNTHFVNNIPAIGRLTQTDFADSTTSTRLMAWQIAFKAWQDRPILGFGPNNFYYAFNKFYDPDFLNYGYGETWFDNAHSAIMNTLAVQGLFGLVFYCFIFIFSIYSLFKSYRCGYIDLHIFSVSFAFLAAHFVHNAFVFENPTSYLCFFFFIAFANQSTHKPVLATEKQNKKYEIYFPVYVYLVIFIPILFFIYITDIKPAKANMASFRMMKLVETGQDVLGLYKKVEKISSPHIDDLRIDFARTASQQLKALATIGPSERTKSIFLKVHEELNKDLALHPLDIRIHMLFYSLLEDGFAIFNEPKYILELEKIMDDAMQKSPKRQQIEYMAAAVKTQLRKTAEAEKILKQTIENNPKIADSWARLALMYKDTGRPVEAKKVIKEAISNGIVFSGNWKAFVDGL